MIKKLKYTNSEGYVLPDKKQYIGTVNDPIVDKLNEVIDAYNKLINKPVETTNEQPTHLVMMYNYPHEFINIKNINKKKYFKGFNKEERDATKFIPIKLGELG